MKYLVKSALMLSQTGEWVPAGQIHELKGISKKFIKWALDNGLIEQLEGDPIELTAEEAAELADHTGCCG